MKKFLVESIHEESVVAAIASAKWRVRFYAPGLSVAVAKALIEKAEAFRVTPAQKGFRLGFSRSPDFRVAVEVTPRAILDGWGEADAIRKLWVYDVEQHTSEAERWFYVTKSLRIGILIVDDETLLFAPLQKAVDGGWNGMRTTYELMLKEVEADFLSSPIAERLVSAADIEALVNAELLTREALEGRVHEMEDIIKEKEEVIAKKDEEIEKQKIELEQEKARADAAEGKLNTEKENAVKEAEKKYKFPPVYDVMLSLEKFNLQKMSFNIPQEFLIKVFPDKKESDINALKAALNLSKEECEEICEEDYNEIMGEIVKLRAKYLFQVSYEPPSEEFGNKKRSAHVLFREDNEMFRSEKDALINRVTELREKYAKRITDRLVGKLCDIFGLNQNQVNHFVRKYKLHTKFNPRISFEFNKISPEFYESESFKDGLYDTLYKLYELSKKEDKVRIELPELKESISVENTGREKFLKCGGDIEKLYELQFPEEKKQEEVNKKDKE